MSILLEKPPSQGSDDISWRTKFFEDDSLANLEVSINTYLSTLPLDDTPRHTLWLADIQYQAEGDEDDERMHSVMLLIGEYNA